MKKSVIFIFTLCLISCRSSYTNDFIENNRYSISLENGDYFLTKTYTEWTSNTEIFNDVYFEIRTYDFEIDFSNAIQTSNTLKNIAIKNATILFRSGSSCSESFGHAYSYRNKYLEMVYTNTWENEKIITTSRNFLVERDSLIDIEYPDLLFSYNYDAGSKGYSSFLNSNIEFDDKDRKIYLNLCDYEGNHTSQMPSYSYCYDENFKLCDFTSKEAKAIIRDETEIFACWTLDLQRLDYAFPHVDSRMLDLNEYSQPSTYYFTIGRHLDLQNFPLYKGSFYIFEYLPKQRGKYRISFTSTDDDSTLHIFSKKPLGYSFDNMICDISEFAEQNDSSLRKYLFEINANEDEPFYLRYNGKHFGKSEGMCSIDIELL